MNKTYIPEIQGVRIPSPITMAVPSMVKIKRKYLANIVLSRAVFIFEALSERLFGNSSLKLETSPSSACWLGIKPTSLCLHINEYNANVPPNANENSCL